MKPHKGFIFLLFSIFLVLMVGCGSDEDKVVYVDVGSSADNDNGQTDDPDPVLDPSDMTGEELYDNFCASCHGSKENNNIIVKTAEAFQTHIDLGTGGMGTDELKALTQEQLISIADYLTDASDAAAFYDTGTYDGAVLYNAYCGACHGDGAFTTVDNMTVEAFRSAIDATMGGMDISYLETLTDDELQAIADYLNGFIDGFDDYP